jgi:hypothetical protein
MKPYPNVKLLDLDLDRSYYTTHGQHLNSSSKELIVSKLAKSIKDMLVKKQLFPIQMPWKELLEENNQSQRTPEKVALNTEIFKYPPPIETEKIESPDQKNLMESTTLLDLPKQQRKQVALMNTDFLWT